MNESKNPYKSPEPAKLHKRKSHSEGPTTALGRGLLIAWLTGLGCILVTLPLERFLQFGLGWLGLVASMIVLGVPCFSEANLQSKCVYFLCSVGAICMTFIVGAFITSLLGGMAG